MAKRGPRRGRGRASVYSPYTGGPDPLAPPVDLRDALEQMHYHLRVIPSLGAVSAITIAPGNLHGSFDPRKGGGAVGY